MHPSLSCALVVTKCIMAVCRSQGKKEVVIGSRTATDGARRVLVYLLPPSTPQYKRYPLIRTEVLTSDKHWNSLVEYNEAKTGKMVAYEIKLSDFGLAKLVADGYSIATTRTGTPQYWAPEVATSLGARAAQSAGQQGYGFPADLWSMGVVLYVLLCGRYPFTGDPQIMERNQIRAQFDFPRRIPLSNEAKYVITSLIRKNPTERMSLMNCLRCKWATKPMIHMQCAFFKPKVRKNLDEDVVSFWCLDWLGRCVSEILA